MNRPQKIIGRKIAFYSGFPQIKKYYRTITKKNTLTILMYHRVAPRTEPLYEKAISPKVFESHIRFLKSFFYIIDINDLKKTNTATHNHLIIITFDDGYRDNYIYAYPILRKYQVPATIFLATDYVDTCRMMWWDQLAKILNSHSNYPNRQLLDNTIPENILADIKIFSKCSGQQKQQPLTNIVAKFKKLKDGERSIIIDQMKNKTPTFRNNNQTMRVMLSWDEVRKMSTGGIRFGSHTCSHALLSSVSIEKAKKEIIQSKKIIEEKTQQRVNTFAYPYGKDKDFTDDIAILLPMHGYDYAFTAFRGTESLPLADPMKIKRKGVPSDPYLFI